MRVASDDRDRISFALYSRSRFSCVSVRRKSPKIGRIYEFKKSRIKLRGGNSTIFGQTLLLQVILRAEFPLEIYFYRSKFVSLHLELDNFKVKEKLTSDIINDVVSLFTVYGLGGWTVNGYVVCIFGVCCDLNLYLLHQLDAIVRVWGRSDFNEPERVDGLTQFTLVFIGCRSKWPNWVWPARCWKWRIFWATLQKRHWIAFRTFFSFRVMARFSARIDVLCRGKKAYTRLEFGIRSRSWKLNLIRVYFLKLSFQLQRFPRALI